MAAMQGRPVESPRRVATTYAAVLAGRPAGLALPLGARSALIANPCAMRLLQSGFLASEPAVPGQEPANSHSLAAATPVPVSSALAPAAGGWGVAIGLAPDGKAYAWCGAAAPAAATAAATAGQPRVACEAACAATQLLFRMLHDSSRCLPFRRAGASTPPRCWAKAAATRTAPTPRPSTRWPTA